MMREEGGAESTTRKKRGRRGGGGLIVNACARRLGSRAGPTGKEESGFLHKKWRKGPGPGVIARLKGSRVFEVGPGGLGEGLREWGGGVGLCVLRRFFCRSRGQTRPSARSSSKRWGGGSHRAGGNILRGGKGWVREARSRSACSRRFSAGSRGEFIRNFPLGGGGGQGWIAIDAPSLPDKSRV